MFLSCHDFFPTQVVAVKTKMCTFSTHWQQRGGPWLPVIYRETILTRNPQTQITPHQRISEAGSNWSVPNRFLSITPSKTKMKGTAHTCLSILYLRVWFTFFSHACGPLVDSSSELRTWAPVEPVKRPGTVLDCAHASTYHTNRILNQTVRIEGFISSLIK